MKPQPAKKTTRRKSTKGALIKGMSKRLPINILDSPIFREHLERLMEHFAGVYVLYWRRKPYYVGLTTNLLGRIQGHRKHKHKGKWDSFTIFRIHRVKYLKDLETLLQNVVATKGNTQIGKVPSDANFNRVLHRILKQHKKTVRTLESALRR